MIIYLLVINIIGFAVMGIDKTKARHGKWRIPEKNLFYCALLGGSLGTTMGMYVFHHKTRHWYFKYGMPLILVIQVLLINYIVN